MGNIYLKVSLTDGYHFTLGKSCELMQKSHLTSISAAQYFSQKRDPFIVPTSLMFVFLVQREQLEHI